MLLLKYLFVALGVALFGGASGVVAYDIYLAAQLRRLLGRKSQEGPEAGEKPLRPLSPVRWKLARQLAVLSVVPFLLGMSIVVVPDGSAGVRASQVSGSRPGTLYSGVHLVVPLVDRVVLSRLQTTTQAESEALTSSASREPLRVARSGIESDKGDRRLRNQIRVPDGATRLAVLIWSCVTTARAEREPWLARKRS